MFSKKNLDKFAYHMLTLMPTKDKKIILTKIYFRQLLYNAKI